MNRVTSVNTIRNKYNWNSKGVASIVDNYQRVDMMASDMNKVEVSEEDAGNRAKFKKKVMEMKN